MGSVCSPSFVRYGEYTDPETSAAYIITDKIWSFCTQLKLSCYYYKIVYESPTIITKKIPIEVIQMTKEKKSKNNIVEINKIKGKTKRDG